MDLLRGAMCAALEPLLAIQGLFVTFCLARLRLHRNTFDLFFLQVSQLQVRGGR